MWRQEHHEYPLHGRYCFDAVQRIKPPVFAQLYHHHQRKQEVLHGTKPRKKNKIHSCYEEEERRSTASNHNGLIHETRRPREVQLQRNA